jgi:hypothetical protein
MGNNQKESDRSLILFDTISTFNNDETCQELTCPPGL